MMQLEKAEALMKINSLYFKDWLQLQMETFPSIEGILMLDDIIGFMGEEELRTFGVPYFNELYDANVSVNFCTLMPLAKYQHHYCQR